MRGIEASGAGLFAAFVCLPAAAGELICFGLAPDVTQASVVCFDPAEVRALSAQFAYARLYASDSRSALRRTAGLVVDCGSKRAYEIYAGRLEDAAFGELPRAICGAKGGKR